MSGMTASQLTSANLDKSALLDSLIEKEFAGQPDGLLAELQVRILLSCVTSECSTAAKMKLEELVKMCWGRLTML